MTEVVQALEAWHEFFAAIANVAAVLLGLVFVGLAIHVERRQLAGSTRALAIGSAANLVYALLTALAMLIPEGVPIITGIVLIVVALLGVIAGRTALADARRASRESLSRATIAFQFVLPVVVIGLLLVAGGAILLDVRAGVWAVAAAAFILVTIGVQNAWELILNANTADGP